MVKKVDPHSLAFDSKKLHQLPNKTAKLPKSQWNLLLSSQQMEWIQVANCAATIKESNMRTKENNCTWSSFDPITVPSLMKSLPKMIRESQQRKQKQLDSLLSPAAVASCGRKTVKKATRRNCRWFSRCFSSLVHSDLFLSLLGATTESFQV